MRRVPTETRGELIQGLPVQRREPHLTSLPAVGNVVSYHADAIMSGLAISNGDPTIMVMIASPGCPCGCGKPGVCLTVYIEPEHARVIARNLIEMADEVETQANGVAAAALRKAAGK